MCIRDSPEGEAPPAARAQRRVATTTRLACADSPSGEGRRGAPRSSRRWPRPHRTRGSPARPASTTRGGRESLATSTPGRAGMKGGRAVRQVLRNGHPPPRRSPRTTRDGREIERDGASPPRARGGIRARSRTRSVDRSSACVAAARSPIASAGTVASCVLATGAARVSKRGAVTTRSLPKSVGVGLLWNVQSQSI